MNRLGFRVKTINEASFEVYTIIDDFNILQDDTCPWIGLKAEKFFGQDSFFEGKLWLGICGCGCEGCDDYKVKVSMHDGMIVWEDWHRDTSYTFSKSQYEEALEKAKESWNEKQRQLYKRRERKVEKVVEKLLSGTIIGGEYEFQFADASVVNRNIELVYAKGNQAEQKIYEMGWNGETYYNYVVRSTKGFIRRVVQCNEYFLDRTLELVYDFHFKCRACMREIYISDLVEAALKCNGEHAKIVAMLWDLEFPIGTVTVQSLEEEYFPPEVTDALRCLVEAKLYSRRTLRKNETYSHFITRVIKDPIARQAAIMAYDIANRTSGSMLSKAISILYKAHSPIKGIKVPHILHSMRVALHCRTEDEQIVALLHDAVRDHSVTIEDLKQEGFGDGILAALDCLAHIKAKDFKEYAWQIAVNPLAAQVKIHDLRDNMDISRLGGKPHWKMDTYRQMLDYLEEMQGNM